MLSVVVENEALTIQLLSWIDERPRTYEETMDAWRTTCPRLTVWEDALSAGLVTFVGGIPKVADAGRTMLDMHQRSP
jgi:hypothetical protein